MILPIHLLCASPLCKRGGAEHVAFLLDSQPIQWKGEAEHFAFLLDTHRKENVGRGQGPLSNKGGSTVMGTEQVLFEEQNI
jgi:hypothetical protein